VTSRIQNIENITADDVKAALAQNDPEELQFVAISLALTFPDHAFIQEICVKLSAHGDPKVRGNALTSLGYLSRRFRKLDERMVKPVIESALLDSDDTVRELANCYSG
jgi:hypothetical protein